MLKSGFAGETGGHIPIVAITLKRPLATRSISFSICSSVDDGEFRMA
jgi:hypothetical protein